MARNRRVDGIRWAELIRQHLVEQGGRALDQRWHTDTAAVRAYDGSSANRVEQRLQQPSTHRQVLLPQLG